MKIRELDTPALLLDLDAMERNLAKMADAFRDGPARLRPHYKNHKSPALARRQIDAGAIGLTCATLSEAEALVTHGFTDILISSEFAGPLKVNRFIELARSANVKAIVDNPQTIADIAAAARNTKCVPGVLVNINVGQNRTGLRPGPEALELARKVVAEGLSFKGIMGYEGQVSHQPEGPEKLSAYDRAMSELLTTKRIIEQSGIAVPTVTTGGTGTHHLVSRHPFITESQAGSYLLMDTFYASTCKHFECALTVLGTVISKTEGERVVVDAGLKSISGEKGLPTLKSCPGAVLRRLNAEHGIAELIDPRAPIDVGDLIELCVHYSDATVSLHRRMYGVRNGEVEEIFILEG